MIPKPRHLGLQYAEQFKDRSIVEAYHHRPLYPAEVFEILTALITDEPRVVLDVGCGTGDIARRLVDVVARVDAVDFSQRMIETGKRYPGGDSPNLHWIYGRIEDVLLLPPYALITAGSSLHWMEWDVVLSRFREMLTPRGYVAIVEQNELPHPWNADLRSIITHYTTNRDYRPYNLVEELEMRGLFQQLGEKQTAPVPCLQSLDDYIASFHSRNGFSRERMGEEKARAFDNQVHELVSRFATEGKVELQVVGTVVWGKPHHAVQ